MKLAFIGASHWHLPLYLDPALEVPGAQVVGISDPDPGFVASLSDRLCCVGDIDFRALCRKTKPDFVFALGRHCDMVEQARFLIEEGIPFALEKPCCLNAQDVAALLVWKHEAAAFHRCRWSSAMAIFAARLREMSGKGIQYMTYRFIAGFVDRYQRANCHWMLDPHLSGGGCTINLAPHFFDLALLLMDDRVRIRHATMSNAAWGRPIEDYSVVTLERGADICVIETGYLYPAPTSTFDMHYAVRSPTQYLVAHDPETVEVVRNSGERELIRSLTTNVPHYRTFVFDVLERLTQGRRRRLSLRTVEWPAAVFLMTSRPLRTGVVQQALPDILPDGMLSIEPDGVDLLYLDDPLAAPAAHPQKVLGNFSQLQRGY